MIGNPIKAINYLTGLLVDIAPTRPLSFSDLGWCEEVRACSPLKNPFMYPSSVMIFLHSICVMLGLVTLQYVLGQCYLSLSDPHIGNTCIHELYVQ